MLLLAGNEGPGTTFSHKIVIVNILYIIFGILATALFISNFTVALEQLLYDRAKFNREMVSITEVLEENNFPSSLKNKIIMFKKAIFKNANNPE